MTAVADLFARRRDPIAALETAADDVARACQAMAKRFAAGGTLFTFGNGASAADAQHVAVEFIHPVIVGKRALAARFLTTPDELSQLAGPHDIVLGVSADADPGHVQPALDAGRAKGLLTVGLTAVAGGLDAEHVIVVPSDDPLVAREGHVTAYHVLWELVHVFLEHERQPG